MMPVVRLNDATFADLSTLKTWFGTKTPSETIDRIVQEAMDQLGMEREEEPEAVEEPGAEPAAEGDPAPEPAAEEAGTDPMKAMEEALKKTE